LLFSRGCGLYLYFLWGFCLYLRAPGFDKTIS
jgi:hypothetical protein